MSPLVLGDVLSPTTPTMANGSQLLSRRRDSRENDSDVATDHRVSGFTNRTDSSLATSAGTSVDRKSFISGTSSQRQSRSSPQNSVSFETKAGTSSSADAPALQTLAEDLELQITTPEGTSRKTDQAKSLTSSTSNADLSPSGSAASHLDSPSPASISLPTKATPDAELTTPSNRPVHPFAAALRLKTQALEDEASAGNSAISTPSEVVSNSARPPMAGLFAQINARKTDDRDDDENDEQNLSPSIISSRPPHPFLSQISSQPVKLKSTTTTAPDDADAETDSSASSRKPYGDMPRPAFLGGIAGGLSSLKPRNVNASSSPDIDVPPRTLAEALAARNGGSTSTNAGGNAVAIRKNVAYKASAKVRQLHWTKIQELKPDEANVWTSSANNEQVELEWAEKLKSMDIWSQMEATFSSQDAKIQLGSTGFPVSVAAQFFFWLGPSFGGFGLS